ncbi:MAG: restriction endonuclease subunit S [Campylobacter sp.]|uniref:restriction endonuclease subunit S n=1 Tax=Campylobacter sp. TaxID=205 RepID=UPI001B27C46B|nr:restriction endonuclease subunit S [Campylobacter sp.]MBO7155244.1 restriction endonuclease subunit S [Campylobacter sp.]
MQKPSKLAQTPQIRFAGFTDPWERRKLGDCVDVQSGRDYKHLLEGNIPVYGTGGYMLSVNEALSYNQDAIGIGRKGTIDKPYILKAPFWTVDTLFYALPRENNKLDFLNCIFQKINWKSKDESTGVPSLSKTIINNVDIHIPEETEQTKIGTYFQSLDNLITLHQSKFEKLQKIKKSCLQNLFPQNNQNTPKIRFKNFSDEWVESKLKENCIYKSSNLSNSDIEKEGIYDLYDANGIIGKTKKNPQTLDYITIIKDGSGVGRVRLLPKNTAFIGTMGALQSNNCINFLYVLLQKMDFSFFINGATIPHIYFSDYGNAINKIPKNSKEQEKIGAFFSKLDNLITLQQRKVEKLKNIKKALLNKMFI